MLLVYLLLPLVCLVSAKHEEYIGSRVYKIYLDSENQQHQFDDQIKSDVIDYWIKPNFKHGIPGLVMVPSSHFEWFEKKILELQISKDIYTEDVYEYLNNIENRQKETTRNDPEITFDFEGFYRYQQIQDYIYALKEKYANSTAISVEVVEYATTAENRNLTYLRIKTSTSSDKPVIVIEAGANARDWITVSASLNAAIEVLDQANYRLLENFDWIIVPVLNPDGYEYSHTSRRPWIKSRRLGNLGRICPGVNINRNFDIDWQNFDASTSECSHVYAGTKAFSEIESQLVKTILEEYGSRIRLYLSLQCGYGLISYPWHYANAASGMFIQHHRLGINMLEAIGNDYKLDIASAGLSRASGTTSDFARKHGVIYTYNIGIKTEDGFTVAENEIKNVIEQTWRAVRVVANSVI